MEEKLCPRLNKGKNKKKRKTKEVTREEKKKKQHDEIVKRKSMSQTEKRNRIA
jgi:hypothetical protein